jgi:DNA-3-methyladenine glycosylase II
VTKTQFDGILIDRAIRKAERHLAKADPIMKRLIARHRPCPLAEREFQPFHMLASSIISQQLSTQAAAAIKQRLAEIVPSPFVPERFLQISTEQLRAAGLSQGKARYIHDLAVRVNERRLLFDEFLLKDDETVIETLAECPGIGRWTAEMFLIFGLKRLDVFAVGDAGLQRAARLLYGKKRKSKTLLARVAERWRPYRSIASWYLWKSLEHG